MSDLVGNPEDRFSCVAAQIINGFDNLQYLISTSLCKTCFSYIGYNLCFCSREGCFHPALMAGFPLIKPNNAKRTDFRCNDVTMKCYTGLPRLGGNKIP